MLGLLVRTASKTVYIAARVQQFKKEEIKEVPLEYCAFYLITLNKIAMKFLNLT